MFARPKPDTLGVCRWCCMEPDIERDFLNHEPRDLPLEYVRDWFFAAVAEDFGKQHIAWVLPRMMEFAARDDDVASVGNEAAFSRVAQAGFPEGWSEEERAVLQDFFAALTDRLIATRGRGTLTLDDHLCIAGETGVDLEPLLAQVEAMADPDLVELLSQDPGWLRGSIPVNAFWSHSPQKEQMWAWVTSPALADRLLAYGAGGAPGTGPDRRLRDDALRIAETIMAASDPPQA